MPAVCLSVSPLHGIADGGRGGVVVLVLLVVLALVYRAAWRGATSRWDWFFSRGTWIRVLRGTVVIWIVFVVVAAVTGKAELAGIATGVALAALIIELAFWSDTFGPGGRR